MKGLHWDLHALLAVYFAASSTARTAVCQGQQAAGSRGRLQRCMVTTMDLRRVSRAVSAVKDLGPDVAATGEQLREGACTGPTGPSAAVPSHARYGVLLFGLRRMERQDSARRREAAARSFCWPSGQGRSKQQRLSALRARHGRHAGGPRPWPEAEAGASGIAPPWPCPLPWRPAGTPRLTPCDAGQCTPQSSQDGALAWLTPLQALHCQPKKELHNGLQGAAVSRPTTSTTARTAPCQGQHAPASRGRLQWCIAITTDLQRVAKAVSVNELAAETFLRVWISLFAEEGAEESSWSSCGSHSG